MTELRDICRQRIKDLLQASLVSDDASGIVDACQQILAMNEVDAAKLEAMAKSESFKIQGAVERTKAAKLATFMEAAKFIRSGKDNFADKNLQEIADYIRANYYETRRVPIPQVYICQNCGDVCKTREEAEAHIRNPNQKQHVFKLEAEGPRRLKVRQFVG